MPVSAEYDPQADALYVRVREGSRLRAVELDERHYVDVDADGIALGFEVLYPRMGVRIADLSASWGIPAEETASAITAALGQSVPMTATVAADVFGLSYATVSTPGSVPHQATAAHSISVPPPELIST